MKIYLACSLFNSDSDYLDFIEQVKNHLRTHYQLIEFLGIGDHSPEEVVSYDLACVRQADVFIGVCDKVSTGMGIEIGLANSLQTPMLLTAHSPEVSKMILGNHVENSKCEFKTYSDMQDLVNVIDAFTLKYQ